MNERERYLAVTRFRDHDRPFLQGEGMWPETLDRWRREGWSGCPIDEIFSQDRVLRVPVGTGPWPPFERKVFEETSELTVYLDPDGVVRKEFKGDRSQSSMPQFVRFPVRSRADFDRLARTRLRPNLERRFPKDWDEKVAEWNSRDKPLMFFMGRWGGFFGPLRNLLGLRRLCRAFYEEPEFVSRMMDQRKEVILAVAGKILDAVDLDVFGFWEDMAYRDGPLLSPDLFKEFMLPRYDEVCRYVRSRGVNLICVDSDGDVRTLIPLWIRAGLNGIWPLEVQAGMDVVALQREYGRRLVMMGGIDKRVLARSKQAIESEVDRVWPIVESGGYLPHTDHSVPPDVPWSNYAHYRRYMAAKSGVEIT